MIVKETFADRARKHHLLTSFFKNAFHTTSPSSADQLLLEPRGPGPSASEGALTGGCLTIGGIAIWRGSAQRSPSIAPDAGPSSLREVCLSPS